MSTFKSSEKQTRQLKADAGLIYHIIFRQAGTLAKALLEGVMNSIDAGCTSVEVDLDTEKFKITDDGKGFTSSEEIETFFETFGTPHDLDENGVSRDAKFGTFRIGRGQLFAFAQTDWNTGKFRMVVDVKGRGLEYDLYKNPRSLPGCEIEGLLYNPLTPGDLHETGRMLQHFVKWVDVPVTLNGKLISCSPSDPPRAEGETGDYWDEETDDYYLRTTGIHASSGVEVYQQGVHVMNLSSHQFGLGAVVVTKKAVVLNTARNDILASCPVWAAARKRIQVLGGKKLEAAGEKNLRLSDDERAAVFEKLSGRTMLLREAKKLPIFMDTSGMAWSASQISSMASARGNWHHLPDGNLGICFAEDNDTLADRLLQRKQALVLSTTNIGMAQVSDKTALVELISKIFGGSLYNRVRLCTLEEASEDMETGYTLVDPGKATKREELILNAINTINSQWSGGVIGEIGNVLNLDRKDFPAARTLRLGESEVADGWTDGHSYIALNREKLKGNLTERLIGDIVLLLAHEYCHNEASTAAHGHPPEFYRLFHDIVSRQHANWTRSVFLTLCQALHRSGKCPQNLEYEIRKEAEAAYNLVIANYKSDKK